MTTGELIRQARLSAGMTQKQVAEKCGMADSAIRKYESGKIVPKTATRQKIAAALNVTTDDLMSSSEREMEKLINLIDESLSPVYETLQQEQRLISVYRSMNDQGKNIAITMIEDLSKMPQYQEQRKNK